MCWRGFCFPEPRRCILQNTSKSRRLFCTAVVLLIEPKWYRCLFMIVQLHYWLKYCRACLVEYKLSSKSTHVNLTHVKRCYRGWKSSQAATSDRLVSSEKLRSENRFCFFSHSLSGLHRSTSGKHLLLREKAFRWLFMAAAGRSTKWSGISFTWGGETLLGNRVETKANCVLTITCCERQDRRAVDLSAAMDAQLHW